MHHCALSAGIYGDVVRSRIVECTQVRSDIHNVERRVHAQQDLNEQTLSHSTFNPPIGWIEGAQQGLTKRPTSATLESNDLPHLQ